MPTYNYTAEQLDEMLQKAAAASDAKASAEASATAAANSAAAASGSATAAAGYASDAERQGKEYVAQAAAKAEEAAGHASDAEKTGKAYASQAAEKAEEAAGAASNAASSATAAAGAASSAAGVQKEMEAFLSHMAVRYSGTADLPTVEYWTGVGVGTEGRYYYIDLILWAAWLEDPDDTILAQAPTLTPGNIRLTYKPIKPFSETPIDDAVNVRSREIISHICLVEPEIREAEQGLEIWARIWSNDPPMEVTEDAYVEFYWEVIWETDYEAAGILDEEAF